MCARRLVAKASDEDELKQYEFTVFGGTFDYLHGGHKVMLTAGALLTTDTFSVGLTSECFLCFYAWTTLEASFGTPRTHCNPRDEGSPNYIQPVMQCLGLKPRALICIP